jgi:hypothetical protein
MTMQIDYPDKSPTPDQLAKLPKWAQEHIVNLERRTKTAEDALNDYKDNQTPSEFYTEDMLCVGEGSPEYVKRYVQGYKMNVEHDGVRLTILLRQDEKGIDLQWYSTDRLMREVAMVPLSFNKVKIVAKEFMR